MKNRYPPILLEKIFERYQALKKDLRYKKGFVLLNCTKTLYLYGLVTNSLTAKELEELLVAYYEIKQDLKEHWGVSIPLEPNLKIEAKDLKSPLVRPATPLARLIFAYGLSHDSKLIEVPKSKKKVSKFRIKLEQRTMKFLVYTLYNRAVASYRKLGRLFNKDKDTIQAWIDEIDALPSPEKDALMSEFLTSRPLEDIDVLDRHPAKITYLGHAVNLVPNSNGTYRLNDEEDEHQEDFDE